MRANQAKGRQKYLLYSFFMTSIRTIKRNRYHKNTQKNGPGRHPTLRKDESVRILPAMENPPPSDPLRMSTARRRTHRSRTLGATPVLYSLQTTPNGNSNRVDIPNCHSASTKHQEQKLIEKEQREREGTTGNAANPQQDKARYGNWRKEQVRNHKEKLARINQEKARNTGCEYNI